MSLITRDKNIPLICGGHSRPVCYVEHSHIFKPDDQFYILSTCFDGEAHMRYGKTGDWIGKFSGHKGAIWSARFNRNADLVITASADYSAKLWDATTGEEKANFAHEKMVKDVIFSPHERQMISGGFENMLRVWDIERPDTPVSIMNKQSNPIKHIAWNSLHSDLIITAGVDDNVLRSWDVRGQELVNEYKIESHKNEPITSMSITKDSSFIIITSKSRVTFLNAKKMTPLLEFEVDQDVTCAAMQPAGDKFIVGSSDFSVSVISMSGKKLENHRGHHGPVKWVSYAPDGKTYASGSDDGTVRIWQDKVEPYELWQFPGEASDDTATQADPE